MREIAQTLRARAGKVGDGLLWLIATLHVALVASLIAVLFSVAPAKAQEASCGGNNLVDALKLSDPAKFAALEKEAAAVPNGRGTFWKIEKTGIAPSYLLGTMHVTDPRVLAMPEGAETAYAQSATVIVESDEIVDDRKAAAALMMRPDLTMFPDGKSIQDFLDDTQEDKLAADLKQRGIPLTLVAKMKPWIIASFVALPACEMSRKAAGASFLDKKLAEDALQNGKALKGLETLVEQLKAMDALPIAFHLEALIETLALGDTIEDVMSTTTDLYLSGEIGMIMPMMKAVAEKKSANSDAGYADFEQRIIIDRNEVMATRARPILDTGNVFMAVGALHLPGEEGVIELLRKEGFKVTRISAAE
ncbi:TraB/GumN family protein [Pararhizobium antarcticum]|uniref:Polysaccharide biosynthesis protein GumN n=1 Tax=Pararhizobium antarcticum TaxID=1798805 RepID=A0A657LRU0_9HYPH|nr:TraB/GumN family protein [Pararhizobium antarcticum]OJF96469.1 polysaccharide biosynthesis protein GumN [Pararhizobium antarcticum]OJF98010.1 polysaccharide biosynthesis protein GumN [Rhizobium sp. 58]